jgi:hypothetical protein
MVHLYLVEFSLFECGKTTSHTRIVYADSKAEAVGLFLTKFPAATNITISEPIIQE